MEFKKRFIINIYIYIYILLFIYYRLDSNNDNKNNWIELKFITDEYTNWDNN